MNTYTITYEPTSMSGEPGFSYTIRSRGRIVGEGWSRGGKHHAEKMAKADIKALDRKAA